jgi:hypothetical protein
VYAHSKSRFVSTRQMTVVLLISKMDQYTPTVVMAGILLYIFARSDQLDENMEKMIKNFKVANVM